MTKYYDGMEVPKVSIEHVHDVELDLNGRYEWTLKYCPISKHHCAVVITNHKNPGFSAYALSVVGKIVTVQVNRISYEKTDTPTAVDAGSTGVAADHSHGLTYTTTQVTYPVASLDKFFSFALTYEVQGAS